VEQTGRGGDMVDEVQVEAAKLGHGPMAGKLHELEATRMVEDDG